MSRRTFGGRLGVFLYAAPSIALSQGATVLRRIGVLELNEPDLPEFLWKQAEPLRKLGWVEGQNLHVERRYAKNRVEGLQPLAEELVRAKVELIVTGGTPATLAAKRATNTIPIVIRTAGDPVLLGLVASLARPGGNVTGYSQVSPEVEAKSLSLLKELLPTLQRIGVLEWSANPYYVAKRREFEHTCGALRLDPVFAPIAASGEIEGVIAQLARERVQALMLRGGEFYDYRFAIAAAAVKHGLPTLSNDSDVVREAGILVAYCPTQAEQDQLRARYIDLILRGAKPGDLPVQQPTKFELVINLKTAKALGLTISQPLLLRADEVIQ
jgi:putative ABC transport system substrate-binding protein